MDIIYEDKNMLIVNKPAGVLTQSNRSFDKDLTSEVMTYRRKNKEEPYAAVINRLDRPVSGLVLFAKDKKTAAKLSEQLQTHTFNKQYLALVEGTPESNKGELQDYLVKDPQTNTSSVTTKEDKSGKLAKLKYELIKTIKDDNGEDISLLKIHLITGRHHQIRVQLSARNMPIIGDTKYGSVGRIVNGRSLVKRNQIALCAYSLTFNEKTYKIDNPFKQI